MADSKTCPALPSDSLADQKAAMRRDMRSRRKQLESATRTHLTTSLNQNLQNRLLSMQPCLVTAYLAFDGEPDLSASFSPIRDAGFRLALPVIEESNGASHMLFRHWQADDELSLNSFGIAEPGRGTIAPIDEIGIILMPLVAWDGTGGRLGMGAGYYDRALAGLQNTSKPVRMGIAWSTQEAEKIPMNDQDVRLHELITENRRFTFDA